MRVRPVDCGPREMGWTDWLAPMVVFGPRRRASGAGLAAGRAAAAGGGRPDQNWLSGGLVARSARESCPGARPGVLAGHR